VRLIDITKLKVGEEALRQRGLHDELTGLPNRSLFNQRLNEALVDPRHAGRELAVVIVDLNNFKHVNDGLGHKLGDLVLAEAGREIQAVTRTQTPSPGSEATSSRWSPVRSTTRSPPWRSPATFATTLRALPRDRQCRSRRGERRFALAPGDGQDAETLTQKADIGAPSGQAAKRGDRRVLCRRQRRLSPTRPCRSPPASGSKRQHRCRLPAGRPMLTGRSGVWRRWPAGITQRGAISVLISSSPLPSRNI